MLEETLALDAEWLAFIDDDQTARPSWLERHLAVAARDNADAVQPRVIVTFPEPAPFWCIPKAQDFSETAVDGPVESRRRPTVATNGVMMSTRLIRPEGMGLRFSESLALCGGEDGEFFETANRLGAHLVPARCDRGIAPLAQLISALLAEGVRLWRIVRDAVPA